MLEIIHPTWWIDWTDEGYILLPVSELENAQAYFKSQGFVVFDQYVAKDHSRTITDSIRVGLRCDADIIMLDATLVTAPDFDIITVAASLRACRLVFFGENVLLQSA